MKSRNFKKLWAVICIVALTVTSITFSNSQTTKANGSATVNGRTYTVTDGPQGDWTGITCQGIFDNARIHFAWGKAVQSDSIHVMVEGVPVAVDNTSAYGCSITLADVDEAIAAAGHEGLPVEEPIDIYANTDEETSVTVFWTAELKVEEAAETTTRDPSVFEWKDIAGSTNLKYDDRTNTKVVSYQKPAWPNLEKSGVYVEPPQGAGAPSSLTINGVTTGIDGDGDYGTFYVNGAGLLFYDDAFTTSETTIEISYAPDIKGSLVIKNTDIPEVTTADEPSTAEVTTAEEITTAEEVTTAEEITTAEEVTTAEEITTAEEVTTAEEITTAEEPTTAEEVTTAEEPTTAEEITTAEEPTTEAPASDYDSMVTGDTNLALKGTGADFGKHREGAVAQLNDGNINGWGNYDAVTTADNPAGFDIVLDKAYAASSIDQVVCWWRTDDKNFYPTTYKVQFGYNGVFSTVATVTTADAISGDRIGGWTDDARFCTATDFTTNRATGNVDTIRIFIDDVVAYGAQMREVAVFAADPQDPEQQPQAEAPEFIDAYSMDYNQLTYFVTPGENQDDYKYNVYLDGTTLIGEGVNGNYEYTVKNIPAGTHTLTAVSVVPGMDPSEPITSEEFTVADTSEIIASDYNLTSVGQIISVSSFYNENYSLETAGSAIDGVLGSGEGAASVLRTGAGTAATIILDLQDSYAKAQFEQAAISFANPRTYAADVKISMAETNDNESYVVVGEKTDCVAPNESGSNVSIIDLDMSGYTSNGVRYVKFELSKGTNGWGYCVNEIATILNVKAEDAAYATSKTMVEVPELADKVYTGEKLVADIPLSGLYQATVNEGGVNVGAYEVTLSLTDPDNYFWAGDKKAKDVDKTVTFNIVKADNEWTEEPSIADWKYDEDASAPSATAKWGEAVFTYSDDEEGPFTETVPEEAGIYYMKATVPGTDNYNELCSVVEFKIDKADGEEVNPDDIEVLDATLEDNADGSITIHNFGDFEYRAENEDVYHEMVDGTASDLKVGTYYVRRAADDNHNPSKTVEVTVDFGRLLDLDIYESDGVNIIMANENGSYAYGTEVTFKVEIADDYEKTDDFAVLLNGEDLQPEASGDYSFTITDDSELFVNGVLPKSAVSPSGIDMGIYVAGDSDAEEAYHNFSLGDYIAYVYNDDYNRAVAGVGNEGVDQVAIRLISQEDDYPGNISLKKIITGLEPGGEYEVTLNLAADKAQGESYITAGEEYKEFDITDTTMAIKVKADADGQGQLAVSLGFGGIGVGNTLEIQGITVVDEDGKSVYPPETTTEAPTETQTQAPTETATVAPTQATTVAPTQAPTAKKVAKPSKVKIKKIAKKKKSAKKLKITLKKAKNAKGYLVAVYKTKKNAKKNKKALVKKYVTKTKVTIKSKKLKGKKKLFVRARAYNKDGKTKVFGAWSSVKASK